MTEQAVKDAKAKRDAAQADLDKAVSDTKDEVSKANAAIAEAVPEKEPEKVIDPKPLEPIKAITQEDIHPVVAALHAAASTPASPSVWPKVAIAVVVILAALAGAHWGLKLF